MQFRLRTRMISCPGKEAERITSQSKDTRLGFIPQLILSFLYSCNWWWNDFTHSWPLCSTALYFRCNLVSHFKDLTLNQLIKTFLSLCNFLLFVLFLLHVMTRDWHVIILLLLPWRRQLDNVIVWYPLIWSFASWLSIRVTTRCAIPKDDSPRNSCKREI